MWAVLFTDPAGFLTLVACVGSLFKLDEYFGSLPSEVKAFSGVSACFQAVGESVGRVLAFPEDSDAPSCGENFWHFVAVASSCC